MHTCTHTVVTVAFEEPTIMVGEADGDAEVCVVIDSEIAQDLPVSVLAREIVSAAPGSFATGNK